MRKLMTGALAALTLATTMGAGVTAAQADGWRGRGGYDHYRGDRGYHRDNGGAVLGAGILGLAIGAAIGGHERHEYRERYYDGPPPVYYNAPPPAYYYGQSYYNYAGECRVQWRWDRYWQRYVEVERCY